MFLELLSRYKDKFVNDESVGKSIFDEVREVSAKFRSTEQLDDFRFIVLDLKYIPSRYSDNNTIIYLFIDSSKISIVQYSMSFRLPIRGYLHYEYNSNVEDIISQLIGDSDKAINYLSRICRKNLHCVDHFYHEFDPNYNEISIPTIGSFFPKQIKSARNH